MKVLCYSPHNRWVVHGHWDMTIAHGLRHRGAEVRYVMCDGLFSDCDVYWKAWEDRPADACLQCQAGVARLAADNQMPYQWLGRHLHPREPRVAREWVGSLAREELLDARYGDWRIGEWMRGSLHSNFRRSQLDVADPEVERFARSYLYSGLIAAFALDRLLGDYEPDALLVFNGRQSSTRVAFELARARGIRVVVHERGPRKGTLRLNVDQPVTSFEPFTRFWAEWGEVPLTADELRDVRAHLSEREHGVNTGAVAFSPAPQNPDETRAALGLRADAPAWVLFTSSDDEVVADPGFRAEWTQTEWISRTLEFARAHPELDLVIRVHPNTGSRRSVGSNLQQLEQLDALRASLPENAYWIAPDDEVSSYTLMDLATVGLVSHSTVGMEMACKGKAVFVTAPNVVRGTPFVRTTGPAGYEQALEGALGLELGAVDPDVRRLAHRYAYGSFFRMVVPFPLVDSGADSRGERRWTSPDELVPGHDASLDRCVGAILDGRAVLPPPTASERARDPRDEQREFAPAGRFAVLAYAEELIADVSLLRAWGRAFSAADDATLVIQTPAPATEALIAAVGAAGLDREDAPDMMAVGEGAPELGSVVAVLSQFEDFTLPRAYSAETLRGLLP